MVEWEALRGILLPFAVIIAVTTVMVMAVTGRVTQWMIRRDQKTDREERMREKNERIYKRISVFWNVCQRFGI